MQLNASVKPLYYEISGSSANDWHAILPNVTGLEFWTAAAGGTQLTPDGNGNLIDQELSESTGAYGGGGLDFTGPRQRLALEPDVEFDWLPHAVCGFAVRRGFRQRSARTDLRGRP